MLTISMSTLHVSVGAILIILAWLCSISLTYLCYDYAKTYNSRGMMLIPILTILAVIWMTLVYLDVVFGIDLIGSQQFIQFIP
jgi:hypothetical protein